MFYSHGQTVILAEMVRAGELGARAEVACHEKAALTWAYVPTQADMCAALESLDPFTDLEPCPATQRSAGVQEPLCTVFEITSLL